MKSLFLVLSVLVGAQASFAQTPQQFVRDFEKAHEVSCEYRKSSKLEFCLNYTCKYKKYYACSNETDFMTLVLNVRGVRFPGEAADEIVVGHSVQ